LVLGNRFIATKEINLAKLNAGINVWFVVEMK